MNLRQSFFGSMPLIRLYAKLRSNLETAPVELDQDGVPGHPDGPARGHQAGLWRLIIDLRGTGNRQTSP